MSKTSSTRGGQNFMRIGNRINFLANKVNNANCVDAFRSVPRIAIGTGHNFAEMVPLRVVKTNLARTEIQ